MATSASIKVSIETKAPKEQKKVIYIAGPITGVDKYWEAFEAAEDDLVALGYIPLVPSHLPAGMADAAYMRICLAMIDSADAVLFLPNFSSSEGASLELQYCRYIKKPAVALRDRESISGERHPRTVTQAWLKYDLEEVFKK